jgi:carbonic anhydrase/acetyltransferase-like protein (isoleucine patch superfamily)
MLITPNQVMSGEAGNSPRPRSLPSLTICDDRTVGVRPGEQRLEEPDTALIGSLDNAVPSIHQQAWIAPGAVIVGAVVIGRGSNVWYGAVLRADDDVITVGDECNIQDLCCIHVDAGEPAVLADRVSLGHHATVHGAYVGSGALIGMGAVVLGGARIGSGALVAAGAVVLPKTVVPEGVLYAGVPGRVVRDLTAAEMAENEERARRYVDRASRHAQARWHGDASAGQRTG